MIHYIFNTTNLHKQCFPPVPGPPALHAAPAHLITSHDQQPIHLNQVCWSRETPESFRAEHLDEWRGVSSSRFSYLLYVVNSRNV